MSGKQAPGSVVFLDGRSDGEAARDASGQTPEEALRVRTALALERAYGFIETHGGDLAKLRTLVSLEAEPIDALSGWIAERQQADGGFPSLGSAPASMIGRALAEQGAPAALVGVLEALAVLSDHSRLQGECSDRAIRALTALQRDDGSWGEGDEPLARLAWSGIAAGHLARSVHASPGAVARAGDFLAAHFTPDRAEQESWLELLGYAHYFCNTQHEAADETLQWCGRALEKGFREGRLEAVIVTRMLRTCESDALPGAQLSPDELLLALLGEQAGDGGFAALDPEGPPGRVGATVDAVAALVALARTLS